MIRSFRVRDPLGGPRGFASNAALLAEARRTIVTSLNFHGANASTTFTDNTGKAWSRSGTPTISTTQSKYGGSAGAFNGTQNINTPAHPDFDLGFYDFTIREWFYCSATGADNELAAHRNAGDPSNFWGLRRTSTNKLRFFAKTAGVQFLDFTGTTTVTGSAWHLAEVCRTGSNFYLLLDGNVEATATATNQMPKIGYPLCVGCDDNTSGGLNGFVQSFEIRKGECLHTTGYALPDAELAY